jgi:hypothetical protein
MRTSAPHSATDPRRRILYWSVAVTVFIEALTLWLRFGRGVRPSEFNKTAPLVLRIHHMSWAAPVSSSPHFYLRAARPSTPSSESASF